MKRYEISVRSLVEFILRAGDITSGQFGAAMDQERALLGTRLHQKLQKKEGYGYQKEVPFERLIPLENAELKLLGRADGIFSFDTEKAFLEEAERTRLSSLMGEASPVSQLSLEDDVVLSSSEDDFDAACLALMEEGHGGSLRCIDEIKSTAVSLSLIHPDTYPLHFAQAAMYGAMLAEEEGLSKVLIRLTYIHVETEKVKHLYRLYTRDEVSHFFQSVVEAYSHFVIFKAGWEEKRNQSLLDLSFPFASYRDGQQEMMAAIEQAISQKKKLFLQAPTGIGKTMSSLFPSLKAVGEEKAEKVFYLTCKNVTGTVALAGLDLLREKGGCLKILKLTAKETICPMESVKCSPKECPYAKGHFDRVNEAILAGIRQEDVFDQEKVLELSARFQVCPHELQLDLSLFCDVIIGDVNYAFDPSAKLKRFFREGKQPYILLVDEAHNLVERGRDMFSAKLSERELKILKTALTPSKRLNKAFKTLEDLFRDAALSMGNRLVLRGKESGLSALELDPTEEIERIPFDGDEGTQTGGGEGLFLLNERWKRACYELTEEIKEAFEALAAEGIPSADPVLESYFNLLFFERILEEHQEGYEIFLERKGRSLVLHLFCVDPSSQIRKTAEAVLSSVFFSATLQPTNYFVRLLGGKEKDRLVEFSSPFPPENKLVMTAALPQTYRFRERSMETTADLILAFTKAREGRYIVFLPSFQYLLSIEKVLRQKDPTLPLMLQEGGMDQQKRLAFLDQFRTKEGPVVMLSVLGGVFSEGIDLQREELIGAVIVSAALPQISPERDLIKLHFDEQKETFDSREEDGFMVAYTYPGMNRVLQAAGRVIRTETDKGAILLIDERFETNTYLPLFPKDYQDRIPVTLKNMSGILKDFWNRTDAK